MSELEYFKKEGKVSHLEIRSGKNRKVCVTFGFMKVMVNLAREVLEGMEGRWNWSEMVQKRGSGNSEYRCIFQDTLSSPGLET